MYCLHHEEGDLLGSDPVPCPFCGYGAEETPVAGDEIEALGIEDSSDALQHALASSDAPDRTKGLRSAQDLSGYW